MERQCRVKPADRKWARTGLYAFFRLRRIENGRRDAEPIAAVSFVGCERARIAFQVLKKGRIVVHGGPTYRSKNEMFVPLHRGWLLQIWVALLAERRRRQSALALILLPYAICKRIPKPVSSEQDPDFKGDYRVASVVRFTKTQTSTRRFNARPCGSLFVGAGWYAP